MAVPVVEIVQLIAVLAELAQDAMAQGRTTIEVADIGEQHRQAAALLKGYLVRQELEVPRA
jgi:hypothetical protein